MNKVLFSSRTDEWETPQDLLIGMMHSIIFRLMWRLPIKTTSVRNISQKWTMVYQKHGGGRMV